MVLVKNLNFFHLFILGLIGQENVFVNILERKKGFLDSKITKLKKSNIWYFSKGVSSFRLFDLLFLFLLFNRLHFR